MTIDIWPSNGDNGIRHRGNETEVGKMDEREKKTVRVAFQREAAFCHERAVSAIRAGRLVEAVYWQIAGRFASRVQEELSR